MPPVSRVDADRHIGHLCPDIPDFHRTAYATGSDDVVTNGHRTVRISDVTYCGDPAVRGSSSVLVNGRPVHRIGDATGGHGCWVPNQSSEGSPDVIAGD